jgi:hypothetical protein
MLTASSGENKPGALLLLERLVGDAARARLARL